MIAQETLQKIRQLEIRTRRLLSGAMVGDSRSALKGSGFEFDQIRDYQAGDDVRFIDWKSSARTGKMLIKQYIEERSRCVIIVLDVSASGFYSSAVDSKYETMAQVAAMLALVADYGKDLTSLVLFSDGVEVFMPPAKGINHTHALMRAVFEHKPRGTTTSLKSALRYIGSLRRRDAIVFVISDFIDSELSGCLVDMQQIAKKNDLVMVRCTDSYEHVLPDLGFLMVRDLETGNQMLIDARKRQGAKLNQALEKRFFDQDSLFKKQGISWLDVSPEKPFMADMVRFFRRRMMY